MRADEAFPSRYQKSSDVKVKPIIAVISKIERETIGQGKDAKEKIVIHFEDGVKPLVCNRTNWETLEEAFGDSDDWAGHKVKIKTARTQFQGKPVDGIRLEALKPKPALKDELDDEIPDFGDDKKTHRPGAEAADPDAVHRTLRQDQRVLQVT